MVTKRRPAEAKPVRRSVPTVPAPPKAVKVPWLLGVTAAWSWRLVVVTAAAALLVLALIELYVVVVPIVLALFLAAVLEPLAAGLRARRWPRALAATTVFVVTTGTLVALLVWIGAGVAEEFDTLGEKLAEGAEGAKAWAQGPPLNLPAERVSQLDTDLRRTAQSALSRLGEGAAAGARTAGEVVTGLVLMLFTLFFLLKDGNRMAAWMTERIPRAYRADAVALTSSSRRVMRQYVIATGLTGLIDGVMIAIALVVLGVPLVLPLAVLTFLGGFIPIIGATIAGLIAAIVALVTNGPGTALLVVAATLVVQQVEGNFLQPLILERAVRLHPLVTVWAVAAGVLIGGFLGAFLSVPLVAIAVGVGSYYRTDEEVGVAGAGGAPAANS